MHFTDDEDKPSTLLVGVLLALLPVTSFVSQYALSVRAGTQQLLFHHPTVMIVDWIFVPFNYFVYRLIDWQRGKRLFVITVASVTLNIITHAFWQYNGIDPGHMITKTQIVLPAGWVHLAFSILEMTLLAAFVFCRKIDESGLTTTVLAAVYFVAMGVCGYAIHHGFIASDVIVFLSGLFFILAYPRLFGHRRS